GEQKKQLGKNNEAKMTLYNALPPNSQVKNCKIDLLTQVYEKFLISNEETIDSGFTRFNAIVTSLKSLDPDYSSKNYVRKFLRVLPLKWRAKVTIIEEAKDLATLPLDELIGNLKVYETILGIDGVASKPIKDNVMPIALKANVTRGQTSSDSICQDKSNKDEEINLMAKNFRKLFRKCVKKHDKFDICKENTKGGESSRCERGCYNCGNKNHFIRDCPKSKKNKAFENDELLKFSKDFSKIYEKLLQEKIALEKEHSNLFSKVNELELEVKKLARSKKMVEPCENCDVLTKEVESLKSNVSKLQDEALNFSKFKKSSVILDDMLSRQKLSQDKKGLGFLKNDKTTSVKEPLSLKLNEDEYYICCENTTHMMNALKEARMELREMLLSIYHSLKMFLDIISKIKRKFEDEKIKRNDKGNEKVNDF
ncbi:protein CHUP1, chloroplastic, partial [Tanacetum coccineum]